MARTLYFSLLIGVMCLSLFIAQSEKSYANEDLNAEKLVAEHVKSIGRTEYVSKVRSRTFVGNTQVEFIQGASGKMSGTSMFVSDGPKLAIVMKYGDINYPQEYFAFDGKEVSVGHISPGQKSWVGDFLYRFDEIMKEGLIGGTLSASWPLLNIQEKRVDMKCRKTKVDGEELYELQYRPKNGGFGELKVRMYFEPKTYRHVRTEYRVRTRDDATIGNLETYDSFGEQDAVKAQNPRGEMLVGQQRPDSIYVLVEKFGDFKKIGGITLPQRYELDYSLEGSGHSFIAHWTLNAAKWGFNDTFDPKIFQAQK
jgi:hypothetical protein